jgi:hypothetical protein
MPSSTVFQFSSECTFSSLKHPAHGMSHGHFIMPAHGKIPIPSHLIRHRLQLNTDLSVFLHQFS